MTRLQKNKDRQAEPRLGRRMIDEARPGAADLARIALELFAERHFSLVTIRDIGRAAGVNSAMIYYYYKDKEALFRAAIENAIDEAFLLFAEHSESQNYDNAADAIRAWFDVHVALSKPLGNVIKISMDCKGLVNVMPDIHEPIRRFYRHEGEILQKFIRSGIEKGTFRDVDPALMATMISTSLDGILARSNILPDFEMLEIVAEFKQAICLHLEQGSAAIDPAHLAETGSPRIRS